MYTGYRDLPEAAKRAQTSVRSRVPSFVWGLGIVSLLTDASTEMVGSTLPLYLSTWLRVGPIALASVDATQHAVTAIMRVGSARLADRTRRLRAASLIGYVTSFGARVALLFGAPTTSLVAGTVVVDRFGKGVRTGPRDALIANGTPPDALGAAFGRHRALDAAGAFLGPLLAYLILRSTHSTGFRTVFAVAALLGGLGVAALMLLVPSRVAGVHSGASGEGFDVVAARRSAWPSTRPISGHNVSPEATTSSEVLRATVGATRTRPPWRLLIVAGTVGMCTVGDALVLIILLRSAHLSGSTFPLLAVATSVAFAVFAGPFGRAADRLGSTRVFRFGTLVLAGTYLAMGARIPTGALAVSGVLLAIGVSYAATDGVLAALVARVAPTGSAATAQAAVQTATSLGRAVGSAAFGVLWARRGAGFGFKVFGVAMIAATAWCFVIDRSRPLDRSQPLDDED